VSWDITSHDGIYSGSSDRRMRRAKGKEAGDNKNGEGYVQCEALLDRYMVLYDSGRDGVSM